MKRPVDLQAGYVRIGAGCLTRRRAIAGATAALAAAVAPAWAQTASVSRFGAVRVDVQPLIARGGRGPAQLIAAVLPGKLAESFADRVGAEAKAPVLVARIDQIYLSGIESTNSGFGKFGSIDTLEGAGVVVAGRQVLSTTPLRVTLPASYSGVYYLPDFDQRRIVSLCESFASWLRREV